MHSRAVGVGTTSTEVWLTTAFLSTSARRPTAGVQKKRKKNALDGISIFHPPRSLITQCVTPARSCKARWNERRNPTWTDKPSSFLSVLVEGETAINPSQTILLLVNLSRFKSLRPRKSRQAVRSKKNGALKVYLLLHPVLFPGSTSGASEHGGFCVPCALFHTRKSWSRCWAVDHEAYDQLELIYISSCVEGRNCMMLKRWLDMADRTDRASDLLTKIGQNVIVWNRGLRGREEKEDKMCSFRHNLHKISFLKSNSPQYPLGYAPGGATSHSLWLTLSFDSGLLWEGTKSFFFENHFKEKSPGRMYTKCRVRDVHASRSLSCIKFSNITEKLPTFCSKSDFSQVKRYCNPHLFRKSTIFGRA